MYLESELCGAQETDTDQARHGHFRTENEGQEALAVPIKHSETHSDNHNEDLSDICAYTKCF